MRTTLISATIVGIVLSACSQPQQCPPPQAPPPAPATLPPPAPVDAPKAEAPKQNVSPDAPKQKGSAGVAQADWAKQVADWGRAHKSALAMGVAAQALREVDLKKLDAQPTAQPAAQPTAQPAAATPAKPAKAATELTADGLFKEALAMADGPQTKKAVEAMQKQQVQTRGGLFGAQVAVGVVLPQSTNCYKVALKGDEVAIVALSGDGDTDLDLTVRDENGNLVCRGAGFSDDEVCSFTPAWTGTFELCAINLGSVANAYMIGTN